MTTPSGVAMAQGSQEQVVNIGLAILILKGPSKIALSAYLESSQHKLTPLELASVTAVPDQNITLRRLCTLLTLKQSYARAIGSNTAFKWTCLEFNMEKQSATIDGDALTGWEFRIYRAKLGVACGDKLVEEDYSCCCVFFRGYDELKFIWHESPRDLETWVQFISIDQIVKVISSLSA